MRVASVTGAAAAAGVTFRAVLVAVRAGLLSVLAASAVVVGVALVFGCGWAWIIAGVLGLILSADWRASRAAPVVDVDEVP